MAPIGDPNAEARDDDKAVVDDGDDDDVEEGPLRCCCLVGENGNGGCRTNFVGNTTRCRSIGEWL